MENRKPFKSASVDHNFSLSWQGETRRGTGQLTARATVVCIAAKQYLNHSTRETLQVVGSVVRCPRVSKAPQDHFWSVLVVILVLAVRVLVPGVPGLCLDFCTVKMVLLTSLLVHPPSFNGSRSFCMFYSQPKCDHVCCCLSAVKFLRYVSPRVSSQHCLARGTRLMTSNNLSLWCWSLGCGLSVGLASMVLLSSQVVGTDTYSVRQKNVVADPPLLFRLSLGQKKPTRIKLLPRSSS